MTVKFDLIHGTGQHLSGPFADFYLQFFTGLLHRFSCNIRRTGRIRSGIIRRSIGICPRYDDIFHRTIQTFCCHLSQDRIAACSHVCRTDHQCIDSVLIQFNRCRADINTRNTGPLHRHTDTDTSHFAVSHITAWEFFIPSDHLFGSQKAPVQCTALCRLAVICRHRLTFTNHIFQAKLDRIHPQSSRQFIDCTLYSKNTLSRSISTVCSR